MWTPGGELVWKKFEEPRDSQESFGPGAGKTDLQLWKEPGARDRVARRHLPWEESQSMGAMDRNKGELGECLGPPACNP